MSNSTHPSTKTPHIWILDDDKGILEVSTIVLEETGFLVTPFLSKEEFDAALTAQVPDLFLLDMLLSGADGREVSRALKSDPRTAHIPVIIMSADTHIEKKAQEGSIDAYIKKPYDIDELEKLVKSLLK